jgi:hypothetical protein
MMRSLASESSRQGLLAPHPLQEIKHKNKLGFFCTLHPVAKSSLFTMAKSFRELIGVPPSKASTKDSVLIIIDAQNEYTLLLLYASTLLTDTGMRRDT